MHNVKKLSPSRLVRVRVRAYVCVYKMDMNAFFVVHPRPRVQGGRTALINSAQSGNLEVVRLLLESKADIHAASEVP
jgi:hypothetical protein